MKMTPDDKRTAALALEGLLEPDEYMHLLRKCRPKHKRRPSFVRMARLAKQARPRRRSIARRLDDAEGQRKELTALKQLILGTRC